MSIVVVGGGPAGLAAAACAAESCRHVMLIDDNRAAGGQIWRADAKVTAPFLSNPHIELLVETRVIDGSTSDLRLENNGRSRVATYDKLILATGARELFLPFPGWTLPGVFGAGGLQALVKSGLSIRDKRVVIAGTGPLLLAVASYLRKQGASVLLIAEQASWSNLLPFAARLPWSKYGEAVRLWSRRFSPSTWVVSAEGATKLERITVSHSGRTSSIACEYLAVGYGLIPNVEAADLLGCDPSHIDEYQTSSLANVYCAGEMTGVGGVELAVIEGKIAGYAAAGHFIKARDLFDSRTRWRAFANRLADAFRLRPELKMLAQPDTIVCRCEDVPYSRLACETSWREAKLQTRCGMGPCQGRICGPATQLLFGWAAEPVRPPLLPTPVETLIRENS